MNEQKKKKWMNFQHENENYGHLCCFEAKSREKKLVLGKNCSQRYKF